MVKKIAVIEDNLEMRENIAELLELSNYEVVTAPDGKTGVELVKNELPDLIICDIMMPGLDGHSVLYMLQKDPNTQNIPFLFLTAKAKKEDFRKGMNLGADDYLTKPFTEMDLLNTVEKRMNKKSVSNATNLDGFFESKELKQMVNRLIEFDQVGSKVYNKRSNVYFEGDSANNLFVIKSGLARMYRENEDGKEFSLELLTEHDLFGFSGLVADRIYKESIMVVDNLEVAILPMDLFVAELCKNTDLNTSFIHYLISINNKRNKELAELAYDSVRLRVSKVLSKLNDKIKEEWIQMSREELASLVGTSTESVIRMLGEFKGDGIIEVKGTAIRILKPEDLVNAHF